MSKQGKVATVSLLITAILWGIVASTIDYSISLLVILLAIGATIFTICMGTTTITKRFMKKASPYLVFGIVDMAIELCLLMYAVYDIMTDTGIMAGLLGMLVLIAVVPIPIVLLIIDVILYLMNRKKNNK